MTKTRKKTIWQALFLILLIAGTVYAIRSGKARAPYQRNEGYVFGTLYHITYQHNSDLQNEIEAELQKVDASLSPFNKTSVITRINNNEAVVPDSMFLQVFNLAKEISTNTDGAFDITVAPLVNAWGFGFKNETQITPELIDSLRQFVGFEKVALRDGQIVKQDPRVILDCSAIAKGYGSDVVARLFDRKGIRNYMIEIGGEIVVRGVNPDMRKWRVGINKPVEDTLNTGRNEIETILEITDMGMATSGNYRNFYYKNGKKYAHTIDPHSGYPVQHSILSSTVLAKDCATADAYATSFMVMGLEKAKEILAAHPDIQACFIYADEEGRNRLFMTKGIENLIKK